MEALAITTRHRSLSAATLTRVEKPRAVRSVTLSFQDFLSSSSPPSTVLWGYLGEGVKTCYMSKQGKLSTSRHLHKWCLVARSWVYSISDIDISFVFPQPFVHNFQKTYLVLISWIHHFVSVVRVQRSHPYKRLDATSDMHSLVSTGKLMLFFHKGFSHVIADEAI